MSKPTVTHTTIERVSSDWATRGVVRARSITVWSDGERTPGQVRELGAAIRAAKALASEMNVPFQK